MDEVRTVTIRAVSDGLDKAVADVNALAAAQGNLAVVSDTSTRAQTSVANALERQQTSLDTTYRSQKTFNTSQLAITAGLNEGLITVDRYNQLMQLAGQRFEDATKKASPLAQGFEGVKDKASDLSRELGPMGAALTAIGPVGLAIGAAIGVAILSLEKLRDEANEAGAWASQLQNAANIIGLNTTQLQGLNEAAAKVGVSANDNITAFERFAVSLGQLRDGSGGLYTQLLKVNPALVNQLSVTKDAATGWNLLAQAYAQADKQQQALIARAAFGRGGAAEGGVLLATAKAGGIGNLQNENAIAQQQIQQWTNLTAEINAATEAATHNFQSIFTTQVLESEKAFADNMLNISKWAKEFQLSDDLKTFFGYFAAGAGGAAVGAAGGAFFGGVGAIPGGIAGLIAGLLAKLSINTLSKPGLISAPAPNMANFQSPSNSYSTFQAPGSGSAADQAASMGVQATQAKALVAALGSVATAQERLDATTKTLDVDLANHTITQETYNRAVAGAKLDALISQQNLHNAAVGQSATVQDAYNTKLLALQKLQQQGAGLSQDEINRQLQLTVAQSSGIAAINAQNDAEKVKLATIGMGTEAALAYSIAQSEINRQLQQGKLYQDINVEAIKAAAAETAHTTVEVNKYSQAMNDAKNAGAAFANDLVSGLFAGKTLMESLTTAANNLGKSLTSSGINNIIKDPTSIVGYVETGIGIVTQALTGNSDADKALKDAQLQWQRMAIDVVNFNLAARGFNLGPLTQELQSLLATYTQLQAAAIKANDQAGNAQAAQAFGQAVLRIVDEFKTGSTVLTPYAQAVKDLTGEAQGLEDTLISLHDYSLANEVAIAAGARITALAKQFADALTTSLQQRINSAQGHDDYNQASALLTQHQQDVLQASQLGISQALVQQTFAAEAQKIVDDAGLVGDSFNDFIKMFPDFAGVVHESSSALQEANDKFNQLTKTISDYLNNLALGAGSTLSPQDQLALAQSNFRKQLGLAAGGDQTAQSSITQYADTYLNQAKGFYASSGGYSDVYNAVTSALQGLIGSPSGSLGAPVNSPLFPTSALSSTSGLSSTIVPQPSVTTAANDNGALFQAQTTQLSQVFTQVGQANIVALQNGVADLCKRLDRIAVAVEKTGSKPQRPLARALAG